MSRSGYIDDIDQWQLIKWRGQVASAIRGKRGQAFLHELLEALDAMPEKKLIAEDLSRVEEDTVQVCAIGSVGVKRGIKLETLDPEDYDTIADAFGIAAPLVRELENVNDDEAWRSVTPEQRWQRVHDWTVSQLKENWPVNKKAMTP